MNPANFFREICRRPAPFPSTGRRREPLLVESGYWFSLGREPDNLTNRFIGIQFAILIDIDVEDDERLATQRLDDGYTVAVLLRFQPTRPR